MILHPWRLVLKKQLNIQRFLSSTSVFRFYERYPKAEYADTRELTVAEKLGHVRTGLGALKGEIALWKSEMYEKVIDDPAIFIEPGTVDFIWKFDNPSVLNRWTVTCDSDHNEGFSECQFEINDKKKAVFHGILQTHVPKDGRVQRAGYCNIRSMRPRKSFKREIYHEWQLYTHLLLRVRGDGRPYLLNISTAGYFDITWNDSYQFVLYTRGGPYWQIAKVPFSRFFLSSKGRVQDKQSPLPLNKISNFGISCGDRLPGPFCLEIDYIALQYDPSHVEESAYELYQMPSFIIGT